MHLSICVPPPRGVNTDTLCHSKFNGMLENVIYSLSPASKHISKERKYTQINFPSNSLTLGVITCVLRARFPSMSNLPVKGFRVLGAVDTC